MGQRMPNVGESIRAGSDLPGNNPLCSGGNDRERPREPLVGTQAMRGGLWFADVGLARQSEGGSGVSTRTTPTAVGSEATASSQDAYPMPDIDLDSLNAVLSHETARSTIANYRAQWRNFLVWALDKGIQALPASPAQVAAYLAARIDRHGHKPATLRTAASAIGFIHRTAGLEDPCASQEVKRTLRSAARKAGISQRQAEALTAEALGAILTTACDPRRSRGGRFESPQTATRRGNLDIAVIRLMRDAMLRISEAAALIWRDIGTEPDGTGRLLIRRSKTDVAGEGAVAFVSVPTMESLRLIREGAVDTGSVFGLQPNQIAMRIKKAAEAAGLGDGFSGHSPRVGMARDLARAGIELPRLMTAGRWRSPAMPAHYIRNETAGRGAVAQLYGFSRGFA